jgi:hypothetical protein
MIDVIFSQFIPFQVNQNTTQPGYRKQAIEYYGIHASLRAYPAPFV